MEEMEYCEESSPAQEMSERGVKRSWLEISQEDEVRKERFMKQKTSILYKQTNICGILRPSSHVTHSSVV
jgi:hypothetical protein